MESIPSTVFKVEHHRAHQDAEAAADETWGHQLSSDLGDTFMLAVYTWVINPD